MIENTINARCMSKRILILLLLFAPAVQAADAELPMTAVVVAGQAPFYSVSTAKNLINTALNNWNNANIDIAQEVPNDGGDDDPQLSEAFLNACNQLVEDIGRLPYVAAAYPFPSTDYGYQLANLADVQELTLRINSILRVQNILDDTLNNDHIESLIVLKLNELLNKIRDLQENELFTQINAAHDISLINIASLDVEGTLDEEPVYLNLVYEGHSYSYLDGILTGYLIEGIGNNSETINILHNPMPAPLPDADSDTDMDSDSDVDVAMDGDTDQKIADLEEEIDVAQLF